MTFDAHSAFIDRNLLSSLLFSPSLVFAQNNATPSSPEHQEPAPQYKMEGLNLLGADTHMPSFDQTILGTNTSFRRGLFRHGLALRLDMIQRFTQNTLAAPVAADQQAYVGQRPFEEIMEDPILTWDLRQLHLHGAQLNLGATFRWVSWNRAGPRSAGVSAMYLYKSFDEGAVEIKAGYLVNHFEYIGMQVGGSLTAGAQGVYAVLPYEVGLSHLSQLAPAFNLRLRGPDHLYFKTGVQRSLDPAGGEVNVQRNPTGFRFIPKGDKLLSIAEAGYSRASTSGSGQMWIRGGYMYNTTPYSNYVTGGKTSGNYCAYLLGDDQLQRTSVDRPGQGLFAGASAMVVPASMNTYAKYFEVRIYNKGTFRSRPNDMVSLLATHSVYSRDKVRLLRAQGDTYSSSSSSVTAGYNLRWARGAYLSMSLSYVTGPAVTPHLANALTADIESHLFF